MLSNQVAKIWGSMCGSFIQSAKLRQFFVWIAAQVTTNHEFSVSSALTGKGYETFVPSYLSVRRWSDRQKACKLPLISGYVFVRGMLNGVQALIVSTPGVLRLVGFGGQVTLIDDAEIQRVRIVADSSLPVEPWSYIKESAPVRITRGVLTGVTGTIIQARSAPMLVVAIEILQRSVAVRIDRSWIEPANQALDA